ncbi:MAG: Na(+)-translocating NADH-quinone reductase subunit A [Cyclobacteriaceae bacterium]|nr:Na(+)-translocating NADH-quinone reductase subunit A [Cyclobacteriaceae bacterium]
MSKFVKLKKGFNIKLVGAAKKEIVDSVHPETFALKPSDFLGMERPKLLVSEGDNVKAGSPLLFDKTKPDVLYTAPVSGEVVEIKRGEKRRLLEIRILADKQIQYQPFDKYTISEINNISKDQILKQLVTCGIWPKFIQRPYGIIANPQDSPKAIFISAFDSHPLAPDLDFILKGQDQYFQTGLDLIKKLTPGKVHLNVDSDAEVSPLFSAVRGVEINKFSGPHPSGNVGVQIHHLDPINKGEVAWTLSPYAVVQIGKLFLEGVYDASKIFAVAGSSVKEPRYYRTYDGACIDKFIKDNLQHENVRFISGNVLTGERIASTGYLGFYHHLITVITEGDYHEFLGWLKPTSSKLSFHRALGLMSFMNRNKEYDLDTNTCGEERAFVQTGVFERVTPMDILPTHLIKAIMAEDYDDMETLGIYEVVEEDLALCEFVDVSKHNIQSILRQGIDLMIHS